MINRIVLAFDSFKGNMSADDACHIASQAFYEELPDLDVLMRPMADGGEGTLATLKEATGAELITCRVMGPLPMMTVEAQFGWIPSKQVAIIEMAQASGLTLLTEEQRNPLMTTSYGTGQLIKAAADKGAKHIYLAIGGSATVDGGVGAASAIGWRFRDVHRMEVTCGGEAMEHIAAIIRPKKQLIPPISVLTDVTNPLLGPEGAAAVFGPQKGATPEIIEILERGLENLTVKIKKYTHKDVGTIPGGGAAGGMGAGAVAMMRGRIEPGVDTIMELCGLPDALLHADWVITGEGLFDKTSLHGKVVSGVARAAKLAGAKTAVIAGRSIIDPDEARAAHISYVDDLSHGLSDKESIEQSRELLRAAIHRFIDQNLR